MRRLLTGICAAVLSLPVLAAPADVSRGGFRVALNDKTGAFALYSMLETARPVPLLASYDNFSGSYFSLLVNGSLYQLNRNAVSDMAARVSAGGAEMQYALTDDLSVLLSFVPVPASLDGALYALCVDIIVENRSDEVHEIELRCLLDTYLGENTAHHFITPGSMGISSETQFSAPLETPWIASAGTERSLLVLLSGADVTEPRQVVLGNKDFIARWKEPVREGRPFDALQSYNNSAMAIYWPITVLNPQTQSHTRFYLLQGKNGVLPDVQPFLDMIAASESADEQLSYTDSQGRTHVLGIADMGSVDLQYLRDLLDRIQILETSGALDRDETLKLIAELDMILERIRRQQE